MEQKLRLVKTLPQIIIPKDKIDIFVQWYNNDLRFIDEIPQAFERGYILLENNFPKDIYDKEEIKKYISLIASKKQTTYRIVEEALKSFFEKTINTIIYFKFENNFLKLEIYIEYKLINILIVDLKAIDPMRPNKILNDKIKEMLKEEETIESVYTYNCFILFASAMWYMTTTTKTTKYYRENKVEPFYYEKKEIINPKRNKTISTPIYDMSKIRKVKIDTLIKRRKGWTYSHSFQVHGHYRHYSDGKTIFIKSFIKGKEKPEISQIITLKPKEE